MKTRKLASVEGTYDIHVHSAPSFAQTRPYDDVETTRVAAQHGMGGILLKDHNESTVTRALLAQKAVPGVKVFGGIVLNHSVGGLNPAAVDVALTMGGKEVWMPTVDAARHCETFSQGGYVLKDGGLGPVEPVKKSRHLVNAPPIRVLNQGTLREEVRTIVEMAKVHDAVIGTSHLYDDECVELVRYCKKVGFKKLVITHADWTILRGFKPDELKELAGMGAWIELCATCMLPPYSCLTVRQEAAWIRKIGAKRCIVASDAGAAVWGTQASVFRGFLQLLSNEGISDPQIELMARENPVRLLGL